jgi:CheY-like chemotaxis protein
LRFEANSTRFDAAGRQAQKEVMAEHGMVLIVDDDENDLVFVRFAFEQAKVSNPIQTLHDGTEAIDYLRGKGRYSDRQKYPLPCLMLLDLKMPRCDGFEVLAWRQREAGLQYFPVVVFTSSNQERDILKAMELGATAYAVKPAQLEYLIAMARELQSKWLEPQNRGRPMMREI